MMTAQKIQPPTSFSKTINNVSVDFADNTLVVSNGLLRRSWQLTEHGFLTTRLTDLNSDQDWCQGSNKPSHTCDWELPGEDNELSPAELLSLDVTISDDEGFTSEHVLISCGFRYPQANLLLQYLVWLYPEFPGMRTQLRIMRISETINDQYTQTQGNPKPKRVELLPIKAHGLSRRYIGYFSDTQNRNDPFLDILKEETVSHDLLSQEWNTWSSAVCLENKKNGMAVVKESHKCVNAPGHDTGIFLLCPENGLANLGWGIRKDEIPADNYANAWGSWLFCWNNTTDRETTFKKFDRLRYPIHLERDMIIQANTWGSTSSSNDARNAARESSVLKEIEVCADLGIDVLQIDDGWQVGKDNSRWTPDEDRGWRPHPLKYTDGSWTNVTKAAEKHGVRLGLWAPALLITFEELVENCKKGGFVQFKLDFAHLDSREKIDRLMSKVRHFIKTIDHQVKVNWDLTEINPRYGYFFAREYGSVYLENRKPVKPVSAIYRPATVLRDLWQLCKYVNLAKFQCSYQNIDMVDPTLSNAGFYDHAYCLAITLMGTPLFFLETKLLSEKAKNELRPLIASYKQVRKEIFTGITYPIGDKPNDGSWTGFQNHNATNQCGYLTIFRELHNPDSEAVLSLQQLSPKSKLSIKDLLSEEKWEIQLDEESKMNFSIPQAPGFRFLKYSLS